MSMRSDRARRRASRRRSQRIVLILVGVVLLTVLGLGAFSLLRNRDNQANTPGTSTPGSTSSGQVTTTASGLKIEVLQAGSGDTAQVGSNVTVHYTGWLEDGTQFDSSIGKQPATFRLASGSLIEGWVQGVDGMQVGEKRRLTIPPDLGYREAGYPPVIPGNATLIFELELLGVSP